MGYTTYAVGLKRVDLRYIIGCCGLLTGGRISEHGHVLQYLGRKLGCQALAGMFPLGLYAFEKDKKGASERNTSTPLNV